MYVASYYSYIQYCSYTIASSDLRLPKLCFAGPSALTVNITKNTTNLSIVVKWDKVDDPLPTTYTVTWTSESDHIAHPATLMERSSYTITGVTLDTVYTITVIAANRCGSGPEYSTSVLLTTNTTSNNTFIITAITNTIAITSAASSSTSTAITKSSTITITASIALMDPSTTTTNPVTTSSITETTDPDSTNPSEVITSTSTPTDIMSPVSTTNLVDKSTADENSKVLSISICN